MSDSVRPHRRQPTRLPVPGILQARNLEWVAISFSNAGKWKVKGKSLSHVQPSQPHGLQPTRLLCPRDFPGKSTGVGCHCLLRYLHYTWPTVSLPDMRTESHRGSVFVDCLLGKEADSNAWVKLTYHWWPHYESIIGSCSLLSVVSSSTISMSSPDLYSNLLFSDLWKAPYDSLALYLYNCCFFLPESTELLLVLQAKLLRVAALAGKFYSWFSHLFGLFLVDWFFKFSAIGMYM